MDAWDELEQLSVTVAFLQRRLLRATEYADDREILRIRADITNAARRREVLITRLCGGGAPKSPAI